MKLRDFFSMLPLIKSDAAAEANKVDPETQKRAKWFSPEELKQMGLRWITCHPRGDNGKGVPIIVKDLGDEYVVVGGAGGSMNFTRFTKSKDDSSGREKRAKKAKEPPPDITDEDMAAYEKAKQEAKDARGLVRDTILKQLPEGTGQVSEADLQKLEDRCRRWAEKQKLSSEGTEELVDKTKKEHVRAVKDAAQEAIDKAVSEALAQAGEAEVYGGEVGDTLLEVPDMPELPDPERPEGEPPPEPKKRTLRLTADLVDQINSVVAVRTQATKKLSSMRRAIHAGDARSIRACEMAYEPMSEKEWAAEAGRHYLDRVEIDRNRSLVEMTSPKPGQRQGVMMTKNIAEGSADAGAAICSELTGSCILNDDVAKDLGVAGSARIIASYLTEKIGDADEAAEIMREYIGTHSSTAAASAVDYSDELKQKGTDLVAAATKGSTKLMSSAQAHAQKLIFHNEAQRVLARCMGSLETAAQVALNLERPSEDAVMIAGRETEAGTKDKAREMGLKADTYGIVKTDNGWGIRLKSSGFSQLYNERSMEEFKVDAELREIKRRSEEGGWPDWEPRGLGTKRKPMPHQQADIKFWERQKNVLIADEAGAGKTTSCLCGIAHLAEQGLVKKALIIVPKSVAQQFGKEVEENLDAKYLDQYTIASGGDAKKRHEAYASDKLITVITHDQVRNDFEAIKAAGFDCMVADEAHYFSVRGKKEDNASLRSKRIRELEMPYKMLMTGTPVKNDLSELHSLVDWLQPGCLGGKREFMQRYGALAKSRGAFDDALLKQLNDRLSGVLMGFQLTTEKDPDEDGNRIFQMKPVRSGQPPVQMKVVKRKVKLSAEQAAKYQGDEDWYLKAKDMPLKEGETKSGLPFARDRRHSKTVNNVNVEDHPKIVAMKEDLARHPDEKVVAFANEKHSWDTMVKGLGLKDGEYRIINGDTTENQRGDYRDEFNDASSPVKFLICSAAANFGMNLQGGSVLMNYDLTDTSAEYFQRVAREFRNGQQRDVTVYDYRTETPFELKGDNLVEKKEADARLVQKLQRTSQTALARTAEAVRAKRGKANGDEAAA